jgi:pimeloyl-ACP methyl ester carboxylesterase
MTGQYANVNGLHLYYEVHGEGRPLIALHGGLGSGEMFTPILPLLARDRRVILPDLQAHARTADIDRPLDVRLMADDIAGLIDHLGLDRPDLLGYSLGGGVAFWTAVKHPELVGRLVLASVQFRFDALYPELQAQQRMLSGAAAPMMEPSPIYQHYRRVAPRPDDFPRLLDKVGAAIGQPFDFTEEVRGLQMPTLIVAADADMAPPAHYAEVFGLLDGGKRDGGWTGEGRPKGGHALAILPGQTHYSIVASPLLAAAALAFLDQPVGVGEDG